MDRQTDKQTLENASLREKWKNGDKQIFAAKIAHTGITRLAYETREAGNVRNT